MPTIYIETNNMTCDNSMNPPRAFIHSAGALLLASAVALFIGCARGRGAILPHEPLFMISLPAFFRVVGGLELAVALACLFLKNIRAQIAAIAWLGLTLLTYRIGLAASGVSGGFNGYLGIITNVFGVSDGLANAFLETIPLYLLAGSLLAVVWDWWHQRQQRLHPVATMSCPACGGHVQFARQNLGQTMPCPHCQAVIVLRQPDNLKMTCVLCGGHIEFPPHAVGQKIACPHCAKTITLLKPT